MWSPITRADRYRDTEKSVMLVDGKGGKQPKDLWKHERSPDDGSILDGHISASNKNTQSLLNISNENGLEISVE